MTTEQVEFLMEHAARLHVALEPDDYASVYASMRKIVLDNTTPRCRALGLDQGSAAPRGTRRTSRRRRARSSTSARAPGHSRARAPCRSSAASAVACCGGRAPRGVRRACKLAGLAPVGLHATLRVSGRQALDALAEAHGLSVSSTADLVAYKRRSEVLVERCGPPARMPTKFGEFVAHCYRSRVDGVEHIALVKADAPPYDEKPFGTDAASALVRVHSECCTGDVFGSLRCDCGPQLEAALAEIERDGHGVLLYLRGQEGRGIGRPLRRPARRRRRPRRPRAPLLAPSPAPSPRPSPPSDPLPPPQAGAKITRTLCRSAATTPSTRTAGPPRRLARVRHRRADPRRPGDHADGSSRTTRRSSGLRVRASIEARVPAHGTRTSST